VEEDGDFAGGCAARKTPAPDLLRQYDEPEPWHGITEKIDSSIKAFWRNPKNGVPKLLTRMET
jgi:hypothetical protein